MRDAARRAGAALGAGLSSVLAVLDTPRGIFLSGLALLGSGVASYSLPAASIVVGSTLLTVVFMAARLPPGGER